MELQRHCNLSTTSPALVPTASSDKSSSASDHLPLLWEQAICHRLERRQQQGTLRQRLPLDQLTPSSPLNTLHSHKKDQQQKLQQQFSSFDFSSNDYLGLAHCPRQRRLVQQQYEQLLRQSEDPNGKEGVDDHHQQTNSNNNNKNNKVVMMPTLGATGSRLLSGDSLYCRQLEQRLARVHHRPAAVLFNSGYDANLSVLSSLQPLILRQRRRRRLENGAASNGDTMNDDHKDDDDHITNTTNVMVFYDELVHNSIRLGMQASQIPFQQVYCFQHNQVEDLQRQLQASSLSIGANTIGSSVPTTTTTRTTTTTTTTTWLRLIVVESVYSMDGDVAPLREILDLALEWNAMVVVDEAHALGVYGRTNVQDLGLSHHSDTNDHDDNRIDTRIAPNDDNNYDTTTTLDGGTGVLAALQLEEHPALLCSVHTFGKAAGCHGAVVATYSWYALYLWNYAMPLVYSTALPMHSLVAISCAYDSMLQREGDERRRHLFELVRLFQTEMQRALALKQREQQQRGSTTNGMIQVSLWPSPSPIQALRISPTSSSSSTTTTIANSLFQNGNECVVRFCSFLYQTHQLRLFPIRAPTVPIGTERVRILLHAHNTPHQVLELVRLLIEALDHVFLQDWQPITTTTSTTTTTTTMTTVSTLPVGGDSYGVQASRL